MINPCQYCKLQKGDSAAERRACVGKGRQHVRGVGSAISSSMIPQIPTDKCTGVLYSTIGHSVRRLPVPRVFLSELASHGKDHRVCGYEFRLQESQRSAETERSRFRRNFDRSQARMETVYVLASKW